MPLVRNFAEGEPYEPQPGECLLLLGDGRRAAVRGHSQGEYLIAQPAADRSPRTS
jgi:hypothetical protein